MNRPLATTKQFRAACKQVLGGSLRGKTTYTDKYKYSPFSDKRYVAYWYVKVSDSQIEDVEFILWSQGVTADTRLGYRGLRGTCVLN